MFRVLVWSQLSFLAAATAKELFVIKEIWSNSDCTGEITFRSEAGLEGDCIRGPRATDLFKVPTLTNSSFVVHLWTQSWSCSGDSHSNKQVNSDECNSGEKFVAMDLETYTKYSYKAWDTECVEEVHEYKKYADGECFTGLDDAQGSSKVVCETENMSVVTYTYTEKNCTGNVSVASSYADLACISETGSFSQVNNDKYTCSIWTTTSTSMPSTSTYTKTFTTSGTTTLTSGNDETESQASLPDFDLWCARVLRSDSLTWKWKTFVREGKHSSGLFSTSWLVSQSAINPDSVCHFDNGCSLLIALGVCLVPFFRAKQVRRGPPDVLAPCLPLLFFVARLVIVEGSRDAILLLISQCFVPCRRFRTEVL